MTAVDSALAAALRDSYVIERELGRGGMATVYLARDLRHDRLVALKVLRRELSASLGSERFLREIRLAARLDHPHVVPLFDSGEAGGMLWYTMPYVEGESLRERLQREIQLPLEDALQITRETADALDYAHRHGIVHRDIKPENLLLSGGHVRVADFGVAHAFDAAGNDRLTETGMALGTPAYMSPEQASGSPIDQRSDVYALGCVLYEMLAGEPPYTGPTPQAVIAKRFIGEVPSIRRVRGTVPEAVDRAVSRALASVPADRWATAPAFVQHLDEGADGTAAVFPERQVSKEVSRPRSRAWLIAASLAGLLIAVVAGMFLSRSQRPAKPGPVDPNAVAVLPFRVSSADPRLAYLRDGMVELLAVKLNGEGGPRAVDPSALFAAWERAGGSPRKDLPHSDALRVARGLQAGRLIEGAVVGSPERFTLNASLVQVSSPGQATSVSAEGPLDSLSALVDQLTAHLLVGQGGQGDRIADLTTVSLPALRSYLEGQTAFRQGRWQQAERHLRRALTLDSSFAQAGLSYAMLAGWMGGDSSQYGFNRAWAARSKLSPRDRALLRILGDSSADPASWARSIEWAEEAARLAPDNPEAWYYLGDWYYHWGAILGYPSPLRQAKAAFSRALTLDSVLAEPLAHLIQIASLEGDTTTARRLMSAARSSETAGEILDFLDWRVAIATGNRSQLERIRRDLEKVSLTNLAEIANVAILDGIGVEDATPAMAAAKRKASTAEEARKLTVQSYFMALNLGRPREAAEITNALRQQGGSDASDADFLDILGGVYGGADSLRTSEVAERWSGSANLQARDLCVLQQWRLARGETGRTAAVVGKLRAAFVPRDTTVRAHLDAASARGCVLLLEAWQDQMTGRRTGRLEQLDSLFRSGPREWWFNAGYGNLAMARLWEARGDIPRALLATRRRLYDVLWPTYPLYPNYLASSLRLDGRLAVLTGDTAAAAAAYRHYLALRSSAEPSALPETEAVRNELRRLKRGTRQGQSADQPPP